MGRIDRSRVSEWWRSVFVNGTLSREGAKVQLLHSVRLACGWGLRGKGSALRQFHSAGQSVGRIFDSNSLALSGPKVRFSASLLANSGDSCSSMHDLLPGEQGGDVISRNVQGAKGRCTSRGQLNLKHHITASALTLKPSEASCACLLKFLPPALRL